MRSLYMCLFIVQLLVATRSFGWGQEVADPFTEGIALIKSGNNVAAIEKLKVALQKTEHKEKIYLALGRAYYNIDRFEQSRHAFEQALKDNGESILAKIGIALVDSATGKCNEALTLLEKLRNQTLKSEEKIPTFAIRLNCDKADRYRTIQYLTDLISLKGKDAGANEYLYLWQLYSETGQPQLALEAIRKVLEIDNTPENRERFERTLADGKIDGRLTEYKADDDRYVAEKQKVPLAVGRHSSLVGAVNMVLKYWDKKKELSQKEIETIDFEGRQQSFADVWLLLKAKGFDSIIWNTNALIKPMIDSGVPIIIREGETLNFWVVTDYDEGKKMLHVKDPMTEAGDRQIPYGKWDDASNIFIIVPAETKKLFIEQGNSKEAFAGLFNKTTFYAALEILGEKDGFQVAKKISQIYPRLDDSRLIMADAIYMRRDYAKAITRFEEVLLMDKISSDVKSSALLKIAVSYKLIGNEIKAKKYLRKAEKVNPENSQLYNVILKSTIAENYFLDKKYSKAIATYKELLGVDNFFIRELQGNIFVRLAVSCNVLGDIINAELYLKKAKEVDPESERMYQELLAKQK